MPYHTSLATGRWHHYTLTFQLANIGSEVSRALNWQEKKNEELLQKALLRTIELLDLTIEAHQHHAGLKELTRVREVLKDQFWGDNQYQFTPASWMQYFDQFATYKKK